MDEEKRQNNDTGAEEKGIRRVRLTSMRRAIAKRLVESLNSIAKSSGSYEVDATRMLELRESLAADEEKYGVRISVTDLVARAMVKCLMEFPEMNAFMTDTEMIYHDYVNLGVAVSVPNGLVTVVIREAEKMSLPQLSMAIKEMAAKARARKLVMEDISDATTTISSLGKNSSGGMGIPLVATPQACIIAFGAAQRKPVVIDEQIVIRSMLRINMSYDHRIVDGAEVSKFNARLKQYIEDPKTILE